MRFTFILFGCLILASSPALGQSGSGDDLLKSLKGGEEQGQIQFETDSLLDVNYYKLMAANSKVSGVPGYRIRIFSESGTRAREQQQKLRARFLTSFPEINTYDDYDGVYFKLYVGDCRTRSEALKLYDLIEEEFPNPIIREGYINIK